MFQPCVGQIAVAIRLFGMHIRGNRNAGLNIPRPDKTAIVATPVPVWNLSGPLNRAIGAKIAIAIAKTKVDLGIIGPSSSWKIGMILAIET